MLFPLQLVMVVQGSLRPVPAGPTPAWPQPCLHLHSLTPRTTGDTQTVLHRKKGQFVCLRALVAQDYSLTDHISRLFEKKQITCSDCYCSQALCAHGARLMLYERYFWCWGFRWIYGLWQMIKQKNNKDKNQQIPLAISKALLHVTHRFCLQCL